MGLSRARELLCWMRGLRGVAALTVIASCSTVDTAEWREEVQLHDGGVVLLDARATRGSSGSPVEHRGNLRTWELCYRPAKAYWKSSAAYKPDVFEIINDKPYVVIPLRGCLLCFVHGFPSFSALVYRWEGGEWKQAAPGELPANVIPNLLGNVWSDRYRSDDATGFYSLQDKQRRDREDDRSRGIRVRNFERQVLDTEKGECSVCKARGDTAVTTRKPADFEGKHVSDGWCE